jgi:hypothetical protein
MSDAKIKFDADTSAAEAKLRKLNATAAEPGRTWQQKVEQSLKGISGKAEGGMALGSFNALAKGFGWVGVAAIAAGAAYQAFTAASDRAVEAAKQQVEWQNKVTNALRDAGRARSSIEAAGAGQLPSLRRSLAMGADRGDIQFWNNSGISHNQSIEVAGILANAKNARLATSITKRLINAGADPVKAAGEGSLATSGDIGPTMRAWLRASGMDITPGNLGIAKRALAYGDKQPLLGAAIISKQNQVSMASLDSLTNGKALRAVTEQVNETLNPEATAIAKMLQSAYETQRALQAAAEAESGIVAGMKEFGRLFGGAGSARNAMVEHARGVNSAEFNLPTRKD